jgi:glutathione S-transferase
MPNITVYGEPNGSSLRVHWMLAELGLEYTTKSVNLNAGEHKTPEFLAINPAGQIPAIVMDDLKMAESIAIVQYLAETHKPELAGTTPEMRQQALQWTLWTLLNVQPHLLDLAFQVWRNAPDEAAAKGFKEKLAEKLPVLEAHLAAHPFVAGDVFTTGDLCVASTLTYGKTTNYDFSAYPAITAWFTTLRNRPAFIKVTSVA